MDAPLYEQIYLHLLTQIKSGQLSGGQRVPSEKELADQFKVSRITSKKALEKLTQFGVIERKRGKGSFVSTRMPGDLPSAAEHQFGRVHSQENSLIGLIVPGFFSESYGIKLLHHIEKRCSERNYHLVIRQTYGRRDDEEEAIRSLTMLGVKGLIVYPVYGEYYNTSLLRLVLDRFPLVVVDRYLKGIPACAVYTDNQKATQVLTEYLLDQGHAQVAFISRQVGETSSIEERIQGFTASFLQRGLGLNPNYIWTKIISDFTPDQIEQDQKSLQAFILEHPEITAFVACEYKAAVLLAKVLQTLNKEIPKDYRIVCFDYPDDLFGEVTFTHIRQDESAMGQAAVDLLIAQIDGMTVPEHTKINFNLVAGKST